MRVAFASPGFSFERSDRQPWVYVHRVAMGLSEEGFEVSVLTDQNAEDEVADAPFDVVSRQYISGIRPLLRGRRLAVDPHQAGEADVLVTFVGWMDLAFSDRGTASDIAEIAAITSPSFTTREWPNLALSQGGQLATQANLVLTQLFSFLLTSRNLSRFDGIVATSQPVLSHLSSRARDQPVLLAPSGVDADVIRFGRKQGGRTSKDGERPIITYCGPMRKERGFHRFLELIRIVNQKGRTVDFQLLLRPDSSAELADIQRLVENKQTFLSRNHVHVETQKLPRAQFLQALWDSTVVVFPFQYSVSLTPVSFLEALAMGIPTVITPVGELRGLIEGTGSAVSVDYSSAGLATALFDLLEQIQLNGSHRPQPVEAARTWNTSVSEWADFIRQTAGHAG